MASPSAAGDRGLAAEFKKTAAGHMREIVKNKKTTDNLELQLLVLQTIRKYESDTAGGSTLGDSIKRRRSSSKTGLKVEDDDDDTAFAAMFAKSKLERGRFLYKTWGITLYKELFRFCFPWFSKEISAKMTDAERFREMMEFQWGLRCSTASKEGDRINTDDKKELFTQLRNEVAAKGDALAQFSSKLVSGYIDWQSEGHYALSVDCDGETTKVYVTAKAFGRRVEVPEEIVGSDDGWQQAALIHNFSLSLAHIMTKNDTYVVQALFPHMCKLKRRAPSSGALPGSASLPPAKVGKGPSDTGGSGSGVRRLAGVFLAPPVLPPEDASASQEKAGVKSEVHSVT